MQQAEQDTTDTPTDVQASPEATVTLCQQVLARLEDADTATEEREALMTEALRALLGEMNFNGIAYGEFAEAMYLADPEAYEKWANNQFRKGLVLEITAAGVRGRLAANIIALFRPQLLRELNIETGTETVMLDSALSALLDHAKATAEVRVATYSGELRSPKLAALHARIMASAQPMQKTFLAILDKLRGPKQRATLNVKAAGDLAIQINEAGTSKESQAENDVVVVAEMECPAIGTEPEAEPVPQVEVA